MFTVRAMLMAPVPVGVLIFARQLAVVAMRAVSFNNPLIVVTDFGIVPDMVIPVVRIVDTIPDADMSRATGQPCSREQGGRYQSCSET